MYCKEAILTYVNYFYYLAKVFFLDKHYLAKVKEEEVKGTMCHVTSLLPPTIEDLKHTLHHSNMQKNC